MAITYPEEITIGKIKFRKSPDQLFLEFRPEKTKEAVEKYLDGKASRHVWRFKPSDRKTLLLRDFNKASPRAKWITLVKEKKLKVDQEIDKLQSDEFIDLASPVYFRPDLKYPNGFALSGRIIARHGKTATPKELNSLFDAVGLDIVEGPRGNLGRGMTLLCLRDRKKQSVHEIARELAKSSLLQAASVDMIQLHQTVLAIPNDTHFADQWNLLNTGQTMSDGNVATAGCDINVEQAWDISKGSPLVVIAVLDTGCDLSHPDILPHLVQPELWFDASTGTSTPNDDAGHGTCCSGIASALTNSLSAQGVAGVGWHCRILPVRMIWFFGYMTSEALILSALNHARNNHADIISMSWHWDGAQDDIDLRLQECSDDGIVMFAASGNYAPDIPDVIHYPASNANVIAVGATNENDRRCLGGPGQDWGSANQGSQYGPELSVVAPGVHTWSTDMQGTGSGYNDSSGGGDAAGDYFEDFGGTSGATPHAAGLAGLMLAYNPTLTPAQVRSIIEDTADDMVGDPLEDTAGWDKYMGHGRINAHAALVEVQTNHPYAPADVYIRDALADNGTEPYAGSPLYYSPDIIVRKNPEPDPQTAFADMTVDPGSDNVEIGNDNYIYIRVHNKGASVTDIHARVYYTPLTTTCAPDLWQYIGQFDFYDVAPGAGAVSDALVWENAPDPGAVDHYCLVASIEGFRDPHPDPAGVSNAAQYMQFIREHNNISYRNVVFENAVADSILPLDFVMGGFAEHGVFDLRVVKDQALRAGIRLKLPHRMFAGAKVGLENAVEEEDKKFKAGRVYKLKEEERRHVIGGLVVAPRTRNLARLEIAVPPDAEPGKEYRVAVEQLHQGKVVGDFMLRINVVDVQRVKLFGLRETHCVHKAGCKSLKQSTRQSWVPFSELADARGAGYDPALDCFEKPLTPKEISRRLARRVLYYLNGVQLPKELAKVAGCSAKLAETILESREAIGRFKKIEEIEKLKGIRGEQLSKLIDAFRA